MTELEQSVREALKAVKYPETSKDIVATGIYRGLKESPGATAVQIGLPTMVVENTVRDAFLSQVAAAIEKVPAAGKVTVDATVRMASLPPAGDKNRMPGVKNVIAVASGKGGVGKSTVATNLALALKRWGAKVGLLDADVFGPSVPTMLGEPQTAAGGTPDKRISPAIYQGMPVMSVAFFIQKADAVVWRGPMVHKLLQQFLEDVDWGELDYLVVDFPPGTGDVQLSMAQLAPMSGAVMVTTPQDVAVIDVVKGMNMFKKLEVPILGVIENMSYYVCPSCGHHDEIFSSGGGRKLAESFEAPFLGQIPLDAKVRFGGDTGMPVVIGAPDSEHARIFMDLATRVAGKLISNALAGPRRVASLVAIK